MQPIPHMNRKNTRASGRGIWIGHVYQSSPPLVPELELGNQSGGNQSGGATQWLDAAAFISKKLPAKGEPLQLFWRSEKQAAYLLSGGSSKLYLRHIPHNNTSMLKEWDIALPAPVAA